jgi:hypothetical protein
VRRSGAITRGAGSLTVLALAAALSVPSIAQATIERSGGYSYVVKGERLGAGKGATLAAPCPENTVVLGGGGYNTGGVDTAVIRHAYPYDAGDKDKKPDDGWKVRWTSKAEVKITSYAICGDVNVRYERVTTRLNAGALFDGGPLCGENRFAISGGSSGPVRATSTKTFTAFSPRHWRTVVEQEEGPEAKIYDYAVCSKQEPMITTATEGLPAGTQQGNTTNCPAGFRIVGGGALSTTPAGGSNLQVLIAATRPLGVDGWEAYYDNYSATEYAYSVQAICLPRRD